MNEILQKSFNTLTMSSREIATLCDKRHDHVCRDIENLNLEYGKLSLPKVGECDYTADNGQTYREFRLTKEQTIDLITGYRADLRIRINRRWQQLEQATAPRLPQTFADALRAYADEVEAHEQTKIALETAKPKAQYFDALVERNLLTSFRITAKELKLKQNSFIQALLDDKYIYRDGKGKLMPYAQHTPSLFEVKEFTKGGYANVQTMITPKGREVFKLLYSQTTA